MDGVSASGAHDGRERADVDDLGAGVLPQGTCTNVFGTAGADCTQADPGEVLVRLEDRDDNFTSYLGGFIGYQYWREQVTAYGLFCNPTLIPNPGCPVGTLDLGYQIAVGVIDHAAPGIDTLDEYQAFVRRSA